MRIADFIAFPVIYTDNEAKGAELTEFQKNISLATWGILSFFTAGIYLIGTVAVRAYREIKERHKNKEDANSSVDSVNVNSERVDGFVKSQLNLTSTPVEKPLKIETDTTSEQNYEYYKNALKEAEGNRSKLEDCCSTIATLLRSNFFKSPEEISKLNIQLAREISNGDYRKAYEILESINNIINNARHNNTTTQNKKNS